jgi:hypothetical protein
MATECSVYNATSTIHGAYYPRQITQRFKAAESPPWSVQYILLQQVAVLNSCRIVTKFIAE